MPSGLVPTLPAFLASEQSHAADAPWSRVVSALAADRSLKTVNAYASDLRVPQWLPRLLPLGS